MGVNGIYGLSGSGIDVESMVKVGMMTKQNEYDKMYKKSVTENWQKEAYSTIYTDLSNFKETMATFNKQSTMNAMKATSSNTSAVTTSANGAASVMTHSVKVTAVATDAYLLSKSAITRENTSSPASIYLKDIMFQSYSSSSDGKYSIKDSEGNTSSVNGSAIALSFTINDSASAMTDTQKTKQTISFTYDDLLSGEGKSLNDLSSAVNKLGLNITASYDSTNDAFSLYNKSGGETNTISITAGDSGSKVLLDNLQLAQTTTNGTGMGTAKTFTVNTPDNTPGGYGSAVIDGKTYDNLSSNTLTVSGVTYTLLAATDTAASVSVTQDTDSVVQSVKDFVTAYNKMIDEINDKVYETKYSDYQPLTKSQESAMTTQQITDWNAKAKSGILYNSSILKSITSNMREALYTPVNSVESNYNSASAIGITSSTNKGHLKLDEDKLKKALTADPDCVYQIFGSLQDSDKTDASSLKNDYSNTGIANRLYFNVTTDGLSTLKNYAGTSSEKDDGSYLGTLITNLQNKMSDFKVQMSAYEDLLYKKYDAMETAISTLSSQLSSVTSK